MLKEIIGLVVSGGGIGLGLTGAKYDITWLIIVGFVLFFVGLRIAVGALIERKIREINIKED